MKRVSVSTKLGLLALIVSFTTGCFGHVSEPFNLQPQARQVESHGAQTVEATNAKPGMIVHIDPETGRFITPPPGEPSAELPQPTENAVKIPAAELREMLSPVPGGGVMIRLDERFKTPLTATIDSGGKLRFEHKQTQSGAD